MVGVFVSYRVREQPGYATLVHHELAARLGADRVFLAARSIRPGEDYVAKVFDTLARCDVMLTIIGEQWTDLLRHSEDDWVYRELRQAFELGLRVIPVLVEDTELPTVDKLPPGITALARCQYLRIRHYSFRSDMNGLVRELRETVPPARHGVDVRPRRATPPVGVRHTFQHPKISVRVVVGDLFDQPDQLVVGFTTTFDTDTDDDLVISRNAVQGQLLHNMYRGDREQLDLDLDNALAEYQLNGLESASDKRVGKLARYPLGTVAVLCPDDRRVFCLAYSEMGNDLIARSTVDTLWASLGSLWSAVALHGRLAPLAMPVVGSEMARIDPLNRENLLKLIMLSYVARSREVVFCKELTIVVHPKDVGDINMTQVGAYLRRL
jgi:hypothetical protein